MSASRNEDEFVKEFLISHQKACNVFVADCLLCLMYHDLCVGHYTSVGTADN